MLVVGPSGSGKTTLALELVRRWAALWKFIFDPDLEWSTKLGAVPVATAAGLQEATVRGGVICFDPATMFAGRPRQAFAFFTQFAMNVSKLLNGPKLLVLDEVQNYTETGRGGIPPGFSEVLHTGRRHELDVLMVSQAPNRVHDEIRTQLTMVHAFQFEDDLQLRWLREMGFDPEMIRTLPLYGFAKRGTRGAALTYRL